MKKLILIATLVMSLGLLAACGSSDDSGKDTESTAGTGPEITDVWARTTTPTQETGAIYMTVASSDGDSLTKASVPASVAGKAEIHETTSEGMASGESGTGEMEGDDSAKEDGEHGSSGHESDNGAGSSMMGMHEVDQVEIPAGESVTLEPGGFHIMLMELKQPIKAGDSIPVTLTFEKAGVVKVDATAKDQ